MTDDVVKIRTATDAEIIEMFAGRRTRYKTSNKNHNSMILVIDGKPMVRRFKKLCPLTANAFILDDGRAVISGLFSKSE